MTHSALVALLADLESDRVERKASLANTSDIRKAICAFANDLPNHGVPSLLFVGVHDDGRCAEFAITDERLRTLADMRSDGNIVPFPSMTVQKHTFNGCEIAVVIVQPSDAPPVRYKGQVWVRIGPRRGVATPQEERTLNEKRRAYDLPFDLRPLPSASINELDLVLFERTYLPNAVAPEVIEENQRTLAQQLTSFRFITIGPDPVPTVLGMLTIGKNPRQYLPGAYIQFLRLDGTNITDPIKDQDEIDGPLPDLLHLLDDKLRAHISTASDFTSQVTEIRRPDYPLVALQQLARNAVLHRIYEGTNAPARIYWFSDRIEIHSPGGPYGQVNMKNFGTQGITDYRNPYLAEVMKNLGYVQRFGVGIATARNALQHNGNPELEFDLESGGVLAILRKRQERK